MPGSFSFCLLMLSPLALSLAVSSPVAHSLLVSRSPAFFPVVWCLCHPRRTRARCARMRDSESSPAANYEGSCEHCLSATDHSATADDPATHAPRLISTRLRRILRPPLRGIASYCLCCRRTSPRAAHPWSCTNRRFLGPRRRPARHLGSAPLRHEVPMHSKGTWFPSTVGAA